MDTNQAVKQLTNLAHEIRSIDMNGLTRPALGIESLEGELQPRLKELDQKLSLAVQYAPEVPSSQINSIIGDLETLRRAMEELANTSDSATYIQHSKQFLQDFDSYMEQLRSNWWPVVIAAILSKGLLADDGIKTANHKAIEELKTQAARTLGEIEEKSRETIEKARELAEQIENRARQTATKISVKEAQSQFQNAQKQFDNSVRNWSIISMIPIALFAGLAYYLWGQQGPSDVGSAIYYTSIRFAVLGSLGALSAFCLRILKAHIHMRQQNLHRQRVANSIEAFVQSAVTPEQRDLILSYLVHSVIVFGNSGLVQEREESMNPSHLAIDSINRTIKYPESDRH